MCLVIAMLKPKYLEQLPENMIDLYSQAEMDLLADMARRISTYEYFIPAAQWQYKKVIEMGNYHGSVMKTLSAMTGKTTAEIEFLMSEAGQKALSFDDSIYKKAGLDPPPLAASPALQDILRIGVVKTNGLFDNLTKTTANTSTKQFERALDQAYMQITSGAFDYNTSIRNAIKGLAAQGIASVDYPTGKVEYLETAVRRAVTTGVNQTALKLQDVRADQMGSDLVETTAHAGARPSHVVWQGQVFSRSGNHPKYPNFVKATGYGTGPGLGGWNCRHSFFPFFEGLSQSAYSREDLAEMKTKNITYNGEKMTEFEASQKQRYIERQIRRWKREYVMMAAAKQPVNEAASKIINWQQMQRDFLKQTGLKHQIDREQVAGFGKSEAALARAKVQKSAAGVVNTGKSGIMISGTSPVPPVNGNFSMVDADGYRELRKVAGKISKADLHTIWDHANGYIQTGNSWTINSAMRSGTISKLSAESQNTIQVLHSVIDKNATDRDFMAVRFADTNYLDAVFGSQFMKSTLAKTAQELKNNCIGQIIEEKSFVSVSLVEKKNVFRGKDVKLKLEIPDGANIYVSSNYQESEGIMEDGLRYILRDVEYVNGKIELTVRIIP